MHPALGDSRPFGDEPGSNRERTSEVICLKGLLIKEFCRFLHPPRLGSFRDFQALEPLSAAAIMAALGSFARLRASNCSNPGNDRPEMACMVATEQTSLSPWRSLSVEISLGTSHAPVVYTAGVG
jgi:hypothetical protein